MEVYAGANVADVPKFDAFMVDFGFEIFHIDAEIMRASAELSAERRRQGAKLTLPDAVILATANVKGLTLITRNSKDFRGRLYENAVDSLLDLAQIRSHLASRGVIRSAFQVRDDLDRVYSFVGYADSHPAPPVLSVAEFDRQIGS